MPTKLHRIIDGRKSSFDLGENLVAVGQLFGESRILITPQTHLLAQFFKCLVHLAFHLASFWRRLSSELYLAASF
jgi:hypothetical protein